MRERMGAASRPVLERPRRTAAATDPRELVLRLQSSAGNHAVASRLARRTLARDVVWKDYFDKDSEQDMESKAFDFDQWCAYRTAKEGYEKADLSLKDTVGSLLEEFENEYQVMLMIVSDAKMDKRHLGQTSLAWEMQGSDRVYVGEGKASKWMPLVRDNAWAIITVGISYGENAGTVMHTINHELSMHGKRFLDLVRYARANYDRPFEEMDARAHALVGHYDEHHAETRDDDSRYSQTHRALVEQNPDHARDIEKAHSDDYNLYNDLGFDVVQEVETKQPVEPEIDFGPDEMPLGGHREREYWLLKLKPESPVATLKVGDIQEIDSGGRTVRVERVAEERFKLWYTPTQRPYNVKVGARIPGSTLKKDGRTYLAPT